MVFFSEKLTKFVYLVKEKRDRVSRVPHVGNFCTSRLTRTVSTIVFERI